MGLFDKKYCDICGEKIGLLGNRKLENGNLCKHCANKLSPWFSDRRSSTVEEIKAQLAYREENREKVASFHTTRTLGTVTKVLLDEDAGKFIVTRARDLAEANPDVLDFADVTGCNLDIDESRCEILREDKDGNEVSYNPPRYEYSYDFYITIFVNNPYFDEIRFQINSSSVDLQLCGHHTTAHTAPGHKRRIQSGNQRGVPQLQKPGRRNPAGADPGPSGRAGKDRASGGSQGGGHLPLLRRYYHAGCQRML